MLAFLDYDGTLTTHECNEIVLQCFVGDAWRPLEAEAQAEPGQFAGDRVERRGLHRDEPGFNPPAQA